jgi:hypothetical protein
VIHAQLMLYKTGLYAKKASNGVSSYIRISLLMTAKASVKFHHFSLRKIFIRVENAMLNMGKWVFYAQKCLFTVKSCEILPVHAPSRVWSLAMLAFA